MKVTVIVCSNCKEQVFSRTRHDYRFCSCGSVGIDGGRSYTKISWDTSKLANQPEIKEITIKQTNEQLYKDWNTQTNKYGIINENE